MSKRLPFQWYDTPNIHLLTINDFYEFAKQNNIKILKSLYFTNEKRKKGFFTKKASAFFVEEAIFVLSK